MDLEILENISNQFNTNCTLDDEIIVFEYNHFTFFNFVKVILYLCTGTFLSFAILSIID